MANLWALNAPFPRARDEPNVNLLLYNLATLHIFINNQILYRGIECNIQYNMNVIYYDMM